MYYQGYTRINCINNSIKAWKEQGKQKLPRIDFICESMILSCYSNSFGYDCHDNHLLTDCYENTFLDNCCDNVFGSGCSTNRLMNSCYLNTIDAGCHSNSLDVACFEIELQTSCSRNEIGASCSNILLRQYTKYTKVDAGCSYITLTIVAWFNSKSINNVGVHGTSSNRKIITRQDGDNNYSIDYYASDSQSITLD